MSIIDIEHYKELAQDVFEQYYDELIDQIPEVSTTTFVLIILAICIPPILLLTFFEMEAAKERKEQPKGCRKLGMKIESNLTNEFDKKFAEGRPPSDEETSAEWWRIKSLWIYPIKSCRGVELNRGTIISTGMEYDRQFSFAQLKSPFPVTATTPLEEKAAHRWEFITQRQYPLLARVRTEVWVPDQSVDSYDPQAEDVLNGGVIILSFPFQEHGWRGKLAQWGASIKGTYPEKHFRIPFNPTPEAAEAAGYKFEDMKIWKETVNALNMEIEIPDELRHFLRISNKLGLFRVDNNQLREVHRCAPTKEEIGWQPVTGFQDAYPLHLINLASVRDVESKMDRKKGDPRLSAARFRANIIITGPEAYNEETWRRIKIGYYEYDVSCRTARCKMPNVDQVTGDRDAAEPDRTIRRERAVDPGCPQWGVLGMQMVPIGKESQIRVGDEIVVLEGYGEMWNPEGGEGVNGEHVYIPQ